MSKEKFYLKEAKALKVCQIVSLALIVPTVAFCAFMIAMFWENQSISGLVGILFAAFLGIALTFILAAASYEYHRQKQECLLLAELERTAAKCKKEAQRRKVSSAQFKPFVLPKEEERHRADVSNFLDEIEQLQSPIGEEKNPFLEGTIQHRAWEEKHEEQRY